MFPNMFDLVYSDGSGKTSEFSEYVSAQQHGNTATYFIQCPKTGEYELQVFVKYKEIGKFPYARASVLVQCADPVKQAIKFEHYREFLGINERFHSLGLVTSAKTTTLRVRKGVARLRVKKTKPAKMLASLLQLGAETKEVDHLVTQESQEDTETFTVKPEEKGLYLLQLFAVEGCGSSYPYAGNFLISNEYDMY